MATKVKLPGSFEDALKALLQTPPPPPGDPSTRKAVPKRKPVRKKKGTRTKAR
jgi:hypothetical protein